MLFFKLGIRGTCPREKEKESELRFIWRKKARIFSDFPSRDVTTDGIFSDESFKENGVHQDRIMPRDLASRGIICKERSSRCVVTDGRIQVDSEGKFTAIVQEANADQEY